MNQLDALKQFTTVVADTGDFKQMAQFQPTDATTNPSLILKAVQMPIYRALLDETLTQHPKAALDENMDRLLVRFGCEILSLLPGRVSTEVDARLSFDTDATLARARRITQLYQAQGIDTEKRVLIELIERIRAQGHTILLIEHDVRLVMGLCDRIAVLDHGQQIAVGTPAEVQSDVAVINAYLGPAHVAV